MILVVVVCILILALLLLVCMQTKWFREWLVLIKLWFRSEIRLADSDITWLNNVGIPAMIRANKTESRDSKTHSKTI